MEYGISETWKSLTKPLDESLLSAKNIPNTNCWIFKDSKNALGFVMTNVHEPVEYPVLRNLEFIYVARKILVINSKEIELRKCLEIHLDVNCDSELLTMVFDRMKGFQPNGHYSSDLMIKTLNNAVNLLQKPRRPPPKEEVIGAWGELVMLYSLIQSSTSHIEKIRMIEGWESKGEKRDIIDFRLPYLEGGTVNEIKTSSVSRLHHINGINQLIIPDNFQKGWLTSIQIRETDGYYGFTCLELLEKIICLFSGNEQQIKQLQKSLNSKIEKRGEACKDSNYHFILIDDSIRMIEMEIIPVPNFSNEIKEINWSVDVSNLKFKSLVIKLD